MLPKHEKTPKSLATGGGFSKPNKSKQGRQNRALIDHDRQGEGGLNSL
ncbi:hypothetical protein SAMN06272774_3337 [Synechococcus sp. 7002]|jgi:hypothetical protein|nr:hypothetical protein SAMN06272774_3337 [Synechococcus sp. 7002]